MENSELLSSVLSKLDRLLDRYLDGSMNDIDFADRIAFRWNPSAKSLKPARKPVRVNAGDLLGVDAQKELLIKNTANFVTGTRANNVLLWGERGTGKSSLVKAMLTSFSNEGLRMVQVYKHDILTVQDMYGILADKPDYRFIIFIDDLSFEENQTDYKELKTIMDGGLDEIPENIVFYATSNRKHLIPTRFSDRDNDVIRPSDNLEEKISLADRFGLRLGFHHITQDTYLEIAELYADKYGVHMDPVEFRERALRWSIEAGGRNGRIAEQFVRGLGRQ